MRRVLAPLAGLYALALLLPAALAAQPDAGEEYLIGPGDRLMVRVAELPEIGREVEVRSDGTFELPVVGVVNAGGLTTAQLSQRVRAQLESQGLRRATVSVEVTSFRTRPVSVLGAVQSPGSLTIPGRTTLLEVLLKAGGLSQGHGPHVRVRRQAENGLTDQVAISIDELIGEGDPVVNIPIFPGDLVHVPAAQPVVIHLLGEVRQPGTLEFLSTDRVTLLTALARAGGPTDAASRKVRVLRRRADGSQREIVADYENILDGDDPDLLLEDGDVVVVKESFF